MHFAFVSPRWGTPNRQMQIGARFILSCSISLKHCRNGENSGQILEGTFHFLQRPTPYMLQMVQVPVMNNSGGELSLWCRYGQSFAKLRITAHTTHCNLKVLLASPTIRLILGTELSTKIHTSTYLGQVLRRLNTCKYNIIQYMI